jgi:hypothetical protein
MWYKLAADSLVVIHLAFILFVALGGLAVIRWKRLAWLHIPAAAWGVLIEFYGWICPLTPLENRLRLTAVDRGYPGGFIDHYLIPLIYPSGLTRNDQLILGSLIVVINLLIYAFLVVILFRKQRRSA